MDRLHTDISHTIPPIVRAALRIRHGDGDGADEIMMTMRGWPLCERLLMDPWMDLAEMLSRVGDGQTLSDMCDSVIWSAATVRGATLDIVEGP